MKLRPHRTDVISLVFGLAFLGGAGLWLVTSVVTLDATAVGGMVAGGLILLGGVGLAQTLASGRDR